MVGRGAGLYDVFRTFLGVGNGFLQLCQFAA
jgi:hypothetical protein